MYAKNCANLAGEARSFVFHVTETVKRGQSAETPSALQNKVQILRNGHLVSRASDYIIYSVEAASIGKVVAQYGPCA
jgi:prephenate dehydrogenase